MGTRADRLALRGEVQHRHEADAHLAGPGTAVIVNRGVARSLVLKCPDGCGDVLTINLDARAGKAWRIYKEQRGHSLFPSVWRESGCKSHFIIWRSHIYWCDYEDESMDDQNEQLEGAIAALLNASLRSYTDVAQELDEVPWTVLVACERLVKQGVAEAGTGERRNSFRRLR